MKTNDATLLTHKAQAATTLCELLLVGPLADGSYRGFAGLDRDVDFAPATSIGAITFKARTGLEMSALQSAGDLSVDNAEAQTLAPIAGHEIEGFTQAQIDSGALDKVRFLVLQVNYQDLTAGRCEIVAGGTIGEVRTKFGQMTVLELRSLSQQLKQMIGGLDSLLCRARFGSGAIGSGAPVEERFPCGYDLTAEWVAGTITALGDEADREFTDSALAQAADYFAPGVVEILDGDNAGQQIEVEAFASGGAIALKFPAVSLLAVGVAYRIRRACTKRWTGHNSCETFWGTDKPLHFRGELHIPVGDSGQLNSPGAALPPSGGGTGE
jgi:uncharacterized phage protein (TIGR02218 family)